MVTGIYRIFQIYESAIIGVKGKVKNQVSTAIHRIGWIYK